MIKKIYISVLKIYHEYVIICNRSTSWESYRQIGGKWIKLNSVEREIFNNFRKSLDKLFSKIDKAKMEYGINC